MRPKKRILIVDTNEERAGLLCLVLHVRGFAVRRENDVARAVTAAREWDAELAIVPHPQTGLNVTAALRELSTARISETLPTLVIANALGSGPFVASRALRRPRMEELVETIAILIARKRGPRKGVARVVPAPAVPVERSAA